MKFKLSGLNKAIYDSYPKIICLTGLSLVIATYLLRTSLFFSPVNSIPSQPATSNLNQDVTEFNARNLTSFKDIANYFTNLSDTKGARYAYQVLKVVNLPPNIDTHLMGHIVGDELYKQEGAKGIQVCTQDFRNACSHSIVIGLLLGKGEQALPEIANACQQAPGGKGAYTMCFHGLGHGVFAYTNYNLEKAVSLCQETGTSEHNFQESSQCISGVIMELITGGDHNKQLWEIQSKKYLKEDDPLYPCDSNLIPQTAKSLCYIYLTPHLFQAAGANLYAPTEANFEKAFTYCQRIPTSEKQNRESCLGGFGKEYVVLAQNRDIRNVGQMDNNSINKILSWCGLGKTQEAVADCINNALGSIYWGGENDYHGAVHFCQAVTDPNIQNGCFSDLIGSVNFYIDNKIYKKDFCQSLPNNYQKSCQSILN